jgi:hypothetical protein
MHEQKLPQTQYIIPEQNSGLVQDVAVEVENVYSGLTDVYAYMDEPKAELQPHPSIINVVLPIQEEILGLRHRALDVEPTAATGLLKKFLGRLSLGSHKPTTEHEYVEEESIVGGVVLGIAPQGMSRQFFYMNDGNWFFISSVKDANGVMTRATTRYHVQPHGVIKSTEGTGHTMLDEESLETFIEATKRYVHAISQSVYSDRSDYDLAA